MALSAGDRKALLSRWIKPSSDDEQDQQDRAQRMVREAIKAHSAFRGSNVLIYTKGSYPNNTNVRRDSDVDVAVELQDCIYCGYKSGVSASSSVKTTPYSGSWTPATWRAEVKAALVNQFGSDGVDASGKIAINIRAVAGSRPSADVVPSFAYHRYDNSEKTDVKVGSCVFPSDGGEKVVNWPQQQLDNGSAKNKATGGRYKDYVRALKNAENTLAANGTIKDLPSYFMECLGYNVPNGVLQEGDLDAGFRATLANLWARLKDGSAAEDMVEPNYMKWLFKGQQKWSTDDAKSLVLKTWNYLAYGD
jgi:hypothetical protein